MNEIGVHDARNGCSRWSEMRVHDAPKYAFSDTERFCGWTTYSGGRRSLTTRVEFSRTFVVCPVMTAAERLRQARSRLKCVITHPSRCSPPLRTYRKSNHQLASSLPRPLPCVVLSRCVRGPVPGVRDGPFACSPAPGRSVPSHRGCRSSPPLASRRRSPSYRWRVDPVTQSQVSSVVPAV